MPYYLCRLAAEDGRIVSQSFLSTNPKECRKHFEQEGFCVLSVKRDWKKVQVPAFPFEKKIKDRDFIMFNQELMALIRAGHPILKSIGIIGSRTKSVALKELLLRVESDIRLGKSLSEAFTPYESYFSKVYTASLMAGEQSGNLAGTIGRYINYAKVIAQTKSRIRSALLYPTLLLVFSFILLGVLINFVLPRFQTFYMDYEAQLPIITRFLISFSRAARASLVYIVLVAIATLLVYLRLKKKEGVQVFQDKLKLKIPYGRVIWLESGVSLFSRTLGLLLEAGSALLPGLGIAIQAIPNKFLILKMKEAPGRIRNGESLTDSMAKAGFFPPLSLDLIRIGESSANLAGMLQETADVYDDRIRAKIDTFVSLIEPIIIIFMGLVVAAMLLSVYLPIFNIIRVVR
jgi:type IV pilus assembly protein PilC